MVHLSKSMNSHQSLIDNHGRAITYLRLAITDRCNLRCRYCMPDQGAKFVPYKEILRYEEMVRLVRIFAGLGINKLRITGGEPFARRDCIPFMQKIIGIDGVTGLFVTTNGIVTASHLDELKTMGISGVNLSLDTLDPQYFKSLTRHDLLNNVLATMHGCLEQEIPLKINTVVLEDTTDENILAIAGLAKKYPLTVRFIEKMPFSGGNGLKNGGTEKLKQRLTGLFDLKEVRSDQPTTARIFELPGFLGKIGVIEGHSRKFCPTCNKLRVTPLGVLKTCLYDNGVLDLKAMLRSNTDDAVISKAIIDSVGKRYVNGLEAEELCTRRDEPSMASIGG
jgi:cyclic pyranopterin phosphate synthase